MLLLLVLRKSSKFVEQLVNQVSDIHGGKKEKAIDWHILNRSLKVVVRES